MKLQLIALALLVGPAQAAPLDTDTCGRIAYIFDACSVSEKLPDCYMVHRAGAGESKDLGQFYDAHTDLDWAKFQSLCNQVCHGKMTVFTATRNFCPKYSPKP